MVRRKLKARVFLDEGTGILQFISYYGFFGRIPIEGELLQLDTMWYIVKQVTWAESKEGYIPEIVLEPN